MQVSQCINLIHNAIIIIIIIISIIYIFYSTL